jgi:hypothetical protein
MPALKKLDAKTKKPRVSRAELAEQKAKLGAQLETVYMEVMRFCSCRPPLKAISGSYQNALDYKDLVSKTRGLILNKHGSPAQLQLRISRWQQKLKDFKEFE